MYSRRQNVFMARKLLPQLIYSAAYVEGCDISYVQTETILQRMRVSHVRVNDFQTIINLRDAWNFILHHYQSNQ